MKTAAVNSEQADLGLSTDLLNKQILAYLLIYSLSTYGSFALVVPRGGAFVSKIKTGKYQYCLLFSIYLGFAVTVWYDKCC